MNISLTILVAPEGLEENFIDFSNNPFPVETGIINLFHYEFDLFIKTINFNDRPEK